MTELKTLKDLGWDESGKGDKILTQSELRQEAIKRVKACESPVDFTRNDRCGKALDKFPYNYCDVCQREIWFNNLTEEDLK